MMYGTTMMRCNTASPRHSPSPTPACCQKQTLTFSLRKSGNVRCHAEPDNGNNQAQPASTSAPPQQQPSPSAAASDSCPTCGVPRSEMASGCNGTGRIPGGIGAVPGMDWWPIKAYRPCGKASAAGIKYVRKGQDIDTVLFGKDKK